MRKLSDATDIDSPLSHIGRGSLVATFNLAITANQTEVKHLVDQQRDAVAVMKDFLTDFLQIVVVDFNIEVAQDLAISGQDVQRCANLVRYLLDELRLHLCRLLSALVSQHQFVVGGIEFLEGPPVLDDVDGDENGKDDCTDDNGPQPLLRQFGALFGNLALFAFGVVDSSQQVGIAYLLAYECRVVEFGHQRSYVECRIATAG